MAGEAVTGRFMLGTATVMVGPMANLQSLGTANSIGLVKNVTLKSTPKFTELSQGVKNSLIASVMTGNDLAVSGEMFEFTSANLANAMGLDGSTYTATATTTTTDGAVSTATAIIPVASTTGFVVGNWVAIHVNALDQIFIRKILSVEAGISLTMTGTFPGNTVALASGAVVELVEMVPAGSKIDQDYLAAKITGQIADNSWITILLGKVRFTGGLNLAFKTDNFDNMPLGFSVYDLLPSDANYALFTDATTGDVVKAMIFSTPAV